MYIPALALVLLIAFFTFPIFIYYKHRFGKEFASIRFFFISAIIFYIIYACVFFSLYYGTHSLSILIVTGTLISIAGLVLVITTESKFSYTSPSMTMFFKSMTRKGKYEAILMISIIGVLVLTYILIMSLENIKIFTHFDLDSTSQVFFICMICVELNMILLLDYLDIQQFFKPKIKRMIWILLGLFLIILAISITREAVISGQAIFSSTSDPISSIFFAILRDPYVNIVIAIMGFGAVIKALNWENANMIGTVIIIFLPITVLLMMFTQQIPTPQYIMDLFSGFAWFAWFFYVIISATLFITVIAIISLITSLGKMSFT